MNPLLPALLQASMRALFLALLVWAGLGLLRVRNVVAQRPLGPSSSSPPSSCRSCRTGRVCWSRPSACTSSKRLSRRFPRPIPSSFNPLRFRHPPGHRRRPSPRPHSPSPKSASFHVLPQIATRPRTSLTPPSTHRPSPPSPRRRCSSVSASSRFSPSLSPGSFISRSVRFCLRGSPSESVSPPACGSRPNPLPHRRSFTSRQSSACAPALASPRRSRSAPASCSPTDYAAWDAENLRVVLAHERAHVRQGDFYLQLLARLYAALFWLSPLGWWLKRKLTDLGEAISDHAGLEVAASRLSYAQVLLEFAVLPRPNLIGVPMAHSSSLSQAYRTFPQRIHLPFRLHRPQPHPGRRPARSHSPVRGHHAGPR